jgi:hypothetical protein
MFKGFFMVTTTEKKINNIYKILGYLAEGRDIYKQDKNLHDDLGLSGKEIQCASIEKTIQRYMEDIVELYSHIVKVEKKQKEFSQRKVEVLSVIDKEKDVSKILKFFLEHSGDLSYLLQIVHENDPELLDESSNRERLKKSIEQDKDIFLFIGSPFEKLKEDTKKIFDEVKYAIKNHEYRNITGHNAQLYMDAKCLKLIHMENNWYLAIETQEKKLRLLRLSFIKNIKKSYKNRFQKKELDKYKNYFSSLQNPMTLNKKFKTAKLLISKDKAHYFKSEMKPFFPTQKFIKELDDGRVECHINYTQELEILPFIKKWQPDITVLFPDDLQNVLISDLTKGIENYQNI